jgi:dTDP-4-amino-4,6-dideoxygalactose transaminase
MISTDFAPNESIDDAMLSLSLLFQPWRWKKGSTTQKLKKSLLNLVKSKKNNLHFFLTGRAALYHYLQQLELPPESEVLVQGFTCSAVSLPILANKLKPIYVDIDPKTFSVTPETIVTKISNSTKVLILQHTFGIPPERKKIIELAKRKNIVIIEDLAHGFDRQLFDRDQDNTVKLLSFGRSKALSSFFGGAIVTPDKKISKKLDTIEKKFPAPSFLFIIRGLLYKPLALFIKSSHNFLIGKVLHLIVNKIGFITREITKKEKMGAYDPKLDKTYPNAFAILLSHQMKKFKKTQKQRAMITKFYHDYFSLVDKNWQLNIDKNTPLTRYPVLVPNRNEFLLKMKKKGLYAGQWYTQPVAPKGLPLTRVKYDLGTCPKAEKICENIINLPTNISIEQAKKIVDFFKTL